MIQKSQDSVGFPCKNINRVGQNQGSTIRFLGNYKKKGEGLSSSARELTVEVFLIKIIVGLEDRNMGTTRPSSYRLNRFFDWLIRRAFQDLRIKEPTVARYVADLLARFARAENLYKIRDLQGRRLETVVEMLLEATMMAELGPDLEKEREIYKHTGDYILFMSGIFREYVEKNGFLGYYLQEGERAYQVVFDMDVKLQRPAYLFLELARRFEFYSGALHYMKKAFFKETGGDDPFLGFAGQLEILA